MIYTQLNNCSFFIERMTPEEYKDGGKQLSIRYHYTSGPFGEMLLARTPKGICYAAFDDDRQKALGELQAIFPNAAYREEEAEEQERLFTSAQIALHIKGTDFQMQVWEELLKVPSGTLTTYSAIASHIGKPKACRAVGSAVGANPVSLFIPCHRVIRATGEYGGYHWGKERKTSILRSEGVPQPDEAIHLNRMMKVALSR